MTEVTMPLKFENAEQQARLTVVSLSNVLSAKDQNYLMDAIRQHGNMRVAEYKAGVA